MKVTTKSIKGFTMVKPNTQQASRIKWFFKHSNYGDIYDAYKSPSHAKVVACMYCDTLAKGYNAYVKKIVSKNCDVFNYQFAFYRKDRKTGEVKHYIAHITKEHNYLLED